MVLGFLVGYPSASDSHITNLLLQHVNTIGDVVSQLQQGEVQEALSLLNSLHSAVTTARAKLTGLIFKGRTDKLTDPFTLPEGIYRVHFTTDGFGAVKVIPLNSPDNRTLLFNVFEGEATDGVSTLYVTQSDKVLVQFSNISALYMLVFEKLD
jgi:hypothetical protein